MNLTVLAASGATGHELTRQALARGHTVTAIARSPARIAIPDSPGLTKVAADVGDHAAMARALAGTSAAAAGALTRTLLGTFMRSELDDNVAADAAVLAAGGTVFHAGPMSDAPFSPARRTVTLDAAPRRVFPARVSRATVAAAMLDEAENPEHPGQTLVPLDR